MIIKSTELKIDELLEVFKDPVKTFKILIKIMTQQEVELETWQRVTELDKWEEMSTIAKLLNYKGFGRNTIFKLLREKKILRHTNNNEPYQAYVDRGYFKQILTTRNGNMLINPKTVVSPKGLNFIRKIIDANS